MKKTVAVPIKTKKMKVLFLTILIGLVPLIVLAEQPDITTQVGPERSEETEKPEGSDLSMEQIMQELERVKEQLKNVGKTHDQLEIDRRKLGRLIIDNNEFFTLRVMENIATACKLFRADQELQTFPRRFRDLEDYVSEDIINATNSSKAIHGYYYQYNFINKDRFRLKAIPATKGKTGERTFVFDDAGGIINEETGRPVSLKKEKDKQKSGGTK